MLTFIDNYSTFLTAAVAPEDTEIEVDGEWPGDNLVLTIESEDAREMVYVVAATPGEGATTLTVERDHDNTAGGAQTFGAGAVVECRLTAAQLNSLLPLALGAYRTGIKQINLDVGEDTEIDITGYLTFSAGYAAAPDGEALSTEGMPLRLVLHNTDHGVSTPVVTWDGPAAIYWDGGTAPVFGGSVNVLHLELVPASVGELSCWLGRVLGEYLI